MSSKSSIEGKPSLGDVVRDDGLYCPRYQAAVELLGRRWTGAIVLALLGGVDRFSELRQAIPGLSDRLLSERLRELESAGIVRRDVTDDVPVAVRYHLTAKGESLAPVVEAIRDWVARWADEER